MHAALDEINVIGKLADLKHDHYQHTLVLSAIIELLVEKQILTPEEIHQKVNELDREATPGHPIA
ncbi:hypothetical protein DUZ99_09800 [Xylanibacillus composti]|nr:hypothetical protein [Xylanibacillus composti]